MAPRSIGDSRTSRLTVSFGLLPPTSYFLTA